MKKFFIDLKRWFSYYKVIRKTYDFDYSSQLQIELHQLKKLRDCISKYQSYIDSWYDIRNMSLAITCLEIILNNDSGVKSEIPLYINTKNRNRFLEVSDETIKNNDIKDIILDDIRAEKAWYIYNKIREEHLREWWD